MGMSEATQTQEFVPNCHEYIKSMFDSEGYATVSDAVDDFFVIASEPPSTLASSLICCFFRKGILKRRQEDAAYVCGCAGSMSAANNS